jgi:uncharacterized protein (DUF1501 family)
MQPHSVQHAREHAFGRRDFLKLAAASGLGWLTPVGELLARQADAGGKEGPAQSVILLWMSGGPSQLETFDPHPDTRIAGGTRALDTAVKGLRLAEGFPLLAEEMKHVSVVRSLVSKEGDHERGAYTVKTGYRPDPTVVHPSVGAVVCHELPVGKTEIPRHVSIEPDQWPGRGGYLGDEYDAFKTGDPAEKVPDVASYYAKDRDAQRLRDLDAVERAFAARRRGRAEATLHRETVAGARAMMTSEQLKAFEVSHEPARVRDGYGDTAFGRGCLAARRLIEVGVRCVEVTLGTWDTHAENHALHRKLVGTLDPAFAALIRDLRERDLLDRTVVLCLGEFGRTPEINPLGGRDHWPKGFSMAIAGGGIRGGQIVGETDPEGKKDPVNPVPVADVHATVLAALGINGEKIMTSPIGRTVKLTEGKPIKQLLG